MFWLTPYLYNSHQCSPLPIEETNTSYSFVPSEHKAGYDRIKITSKVSQCPVCKNKYTYEPKQEFDGYVSWKEVHGD